MPSAISALLALALIVYVLWRLSQLPRPNGGDDWDRGPHIPQPDAPNSGNRTPVPNLDPREAAAIVLARMARAGGPMTEQKIDVMAQQFEDYLALDAKTASELARHASRKTDHVDAPKAQLDRMVDVVLATVSPEELVDLDAMLVAVSEAEGLPNANQLAVLQDYRDKAGIAA